MAQFIQANQLGGIQGSAGQQSIVENRGPTAGEALNQAAKNIGGMVDTAGDIYGKNRGQSLVQEELGNIDQAISLAQKGDLEDGSFAPEGVNVDQKEWDIISNAVRSGTMTQDRARLLASSRVRTRIAENPLFADKVRQSASSILGFNIQSEQARQYFSAFPTTPADPNEGMNKKILEMKQFAQEESTITGIPADKIYRQMWALETSQREKELAISNRDAGVITDQQAFTKFNQENAATAWTGVMGNLKGIYDAEGSIKPETYNQALSDAKSMELQELETMWSSDQTDPAFARAQGVIEDRYESYRTILESVDYDKLNKIIIDRNSNERTLFTDQTFADVKMINEVAGQEGVRAYFDSMSPNINETQRRQMFEQFPVLKRLHSLANASPEEIQGRMKKSTRKFLTGEPLDENDKEVVDPVATDLHDKAEDDTTKTSVFDRLVKEGWKYKGISIVAKGRPSRTSVDNIANTKRAYEEELPIMTKDLGRQVEQWSQDVNRFGVPAIEMEVTEDGDIKVWSARPLSLPQGKLEELRNTASKINQFRKAHDNGWSNEFGEGKDVYKVKVNQGIEEGRKNTIAEINATDQDNFVKFVNSGADNRAKGIYEKLKTSNPDAFRQPFEVLYEEIRRRKLETIEGGGE